MNYFTEQELIRNYQDGDSRALEALTSQHKEKIFTSIYLLVRDKYLAEDIFQDTFIKVIDTLKEGRYKEEGKFAYWVIRIAHNLCVDHFRRVKSRPTMLMSGDDGGVFERSSFAAAPADHHIESCQTRETVQRMVDRLPEEQREVIILRHYADMSFKEIAAICKCSVNTALGRMRYGLLNLRKMVKEKQLAL
jgi:RNA polymerase sigma factor (sigma-70 family)